MARMNVKCMECGKRFKVSDKSIEPKCPKCHGLDVDLDYEVGSGTVSKYVQSFGLPGHESGRRLRGRCMMADHVKDSDCTLNPETNECIECGVLHGDPCLDCGGRGFHKEGCPGMDPEGGRVFACQTF